MNTIKFIKEDQLTTECHNPREESTVMSCIGNLMNPTNLNIVIGYQCNCNCDFCIVRGQEFKEISDTQYIRNLSNILSKLKDLPIEITITGGEPTIYTRRLLMVLELVKQYGFKHRTFSTNGTGLLDIIDNKPLIQLMKEYGAIHNLSISKMSLDESDNSLLMGADIISRQDLKRLALFCDVNNIDLRLSSNVMNKSKGVRDYESMLDYIKASDSLGIKSVIFRELVGGMNYKISLKDISKDLKRDSRFKLIDTIKSEVYTIEVYRGLGYIIKNYNQTKERHTSCIDSLVYREGKLSEGWSKNKFIEV